MFNFTIDDEFLSVSIILNFLKIFLVCDVGLSPAAVAEEDKVPIRLAENHVSEFPADVVNNENEEESVCKEDNAEEDVLCIIIHGDYD